MGFRVRRRDAEGADEIRARFTGAGLDPRTWGNGPGDRYGWHDHEYHKVLYCVSGGITFHGRDEDVELGPGDRLDVDPHTQHAATVGPFGVECMEAAATSFAEESS